MSTTTTNLVGTSAVSSYAGTAPNQNTFSFGGGLALNSNATYYAYSDTNYSGKGFNVYSSSVYKINGSGVTSYSNNNPSNGFGSANGARRFDATFDNASPGVPWEFSPVSGIALGVPLFIGLRILKKRAARKSTASKANETVS